MIRKSNICIVLAAAMTVCTLQSSSAIYAEEAQEETPFIFTEEPNPASGDNILVVSQGSGDSLSNAQDELILSDEEGNSEDNHGMTDPDSVIETEGGEDFSQADKTSGLGEGIHNEPAEESPTDEPERDTRGNPSNEKDPLFEDETETENQLENSVGDVIINEQTFPDENFRRYVSKSFDTKKDGILTRDEQERVHGIFIYDSSVATLKGIEYFVNIIALGCSQNELTSLDISKNTRLATLNCASNQLKSLDVSKNLLLEQIVCDNNQLTNIDVSSNLELWSLLCSNNQLTNLDLSHNKWLEALDCSGNQITDLDVSNNPKLNDLRLDDNGLTNLDVSKNTRLETLQCDENRLEVLDLSNNKRITYLTCEDNQLKKLILGMNGGTVYCGNNHMANLDLSQLEQTHVYKIYPHPQNVQADVTRDLSGWHLDLKKLVGEDKVKNIQIDEQYGSITDGEVILPADYAPDTFDYRYDTGLKVYNNSFSSVKIPLLMTVTVSLNKIPCNHKYEPFSQSATCTQPGISAEKCTICGEINEDTKKIIPAFGHKYQVITTGVGCTTYGKSYEQCSVCGEIREWSEQSIPPLGHSYGPYIITKEATALEKGLEVSTCSRCGSTTTRTIPKLDATMELSVSRLTLAPGETFAAGPLVSGLAKGDYIKLWKSTNNKVVTVDSNGNITAKTREGKGSILIKLASGYREYINITVKKKTVPTKKISGVPKKVTLKKGKSITLKPVLIPKDSTDKIVFKTSNKKVASVSSKGVVKAGKKSGTATITVTSGKKKVTCKVTVK